MALSTFTLVNVAFIYPKVLKNFQLDYIYALIMAKNAHAVHPHCKFKSIAYYKSSLETNNRRIEKPETIEGNKDGSNTQKTQHKT